ncbi:MAG: ATP-dependent DNA helicase RecG, partial [Chitinophagales bacterium]
TLGDLILHFPFRYVDKSKLYAIKDINQDTQYIQVKGKVTSARSAGEGRGRRFVATLYDRTGVLELVWFQRAGYWQKTVEMGQELLVFGKPSFYRGKASITHPEIEKIETPEQINFEARLEAVYPTTEKLKSSWLNSKGLHKLIKAAFEKINKTHIVEILPESIWKPQGYDPAKNNYQQQVHNIITKVETADIEAKIKEKSPDRNAHRKVSQDFSTRIPDLTELSHPPLVSRYEAFKNIHLPENSTRIAQAQYRLKFEELFMIQLNLHLKKAFRNHKYQGYKFEELGGHFHGFYDNNLPFELTGAQKRVLREIRRDTLSGQQMNRLLQGDVGSGKTIVALMCMLMAIDNGFQACMMAPTEILAQQHFAGISKYLKGMDIKVELLTGSVKGRKRRRVLELLEMGLIDILIGTHALIEDTVVFKNLGMVIIDEQHRFGVAQRAKLWTKNDQPPHILVMTATPIPRTLAMTVYGDLDVSVIDELPPGRKPIETYHYFENKRLAMLGFLKKEIAKGRQAYIVYPLINESETLKYKDLMDGYESIQRAFPQPEFQISIVHGQMHTVDKDFEMERFRDGETQIMVATTVIEVGVDVPNASVMVIESSERFGLSQLHQLRGRVGRGGEQSYCILMTGNKLSTEGKIRMQTMVRTNDGFDIADVDLKLRGPGNIEGTQQSGLVAMRIANLTKDTKILNIARDAAAALVQSDPLLEKPENQPLKRYLDSTAQQARSTWSRIS